jgi:hypothetical protein
MTRANRAELYQLAVVLSAQDAKSGAAFFRTNAVMVMVSFYRLVSGTYPRTDTHRARASHHITQESS